MDIEKALLLPDTKMIIYYNEARRQRALDLITAAKAWNAGEHKNEIDESLHIHGQYTDGFYEEQLDRLLMDFKHGT
jgi:hypothetical protein